jgi:transcriptional regulator with XRE-family HTH domain
MNAESSQADDGGGRRSVRGRLPSGEPNPIDTHVGRRLRERRLLLGVSQEELGVTVGVSFQQIQKYEGGTNRLSASRLWQLGESLGCPVDFFYEQMDDFTARASPRHLGSSFVEMGTASPHQPAVPHTGNGRETARLVRAYTRITNRGVRTRLLALTRSLGGDQETSGADERGESVANNDQ